MFFGHRKSPCPFFYSYKQDTHMDIAHYRSRLIHGCTLKRNTWQHMDITLYLPPIPKFALGFFWLTLYCTLFLAHFYLRLVEHTLCLSPLYSSPICIYSVYTWILPFFGVHTFIGPFISLNNIVHFQRENIISPMFYIIILQYIIIYCLIWL